MKNSILIATILLFFFSSCKKDKQPDEIIYEVTLTNSSTWNGSYLNENDQLVDVAGMGNNWRYTFRNTNNLVAVFIVACPNTPYNITAEAYVKIYVNGKLVVSDRDSSLCASAQYNF